YRFNLTGQEGTLWWHSHVQWLRATVYGALVIRPRDGQTYPFVKPYREDTILLGEWWNANVIDVENTALASGAAPVDADAYTFNGWPGDLFNTCVSTNTYRLNVEPGRTYLLRIINAALNTQFFFKIANHSMTVVGADAAYTNPYQTDVLVLGPGQTHDVLMTANQSPGLYYMTASPYATAAGVTFNGNTTSGIIAYQNSTQTTPPILPVIPASNDTTTAFAFSSNLTSLVTREWWNANPIDVESTALASGAAPVDADAYTFNGWPGRTYLLRIINAALNTQFFFKIANHSMTVVGADAAYTNPYQTDVLVLGPGQTHDVLMTANQSPGQYYMTASPYATAAGVTFNQNITTGIIAYQNARQTTRPILPTIPAFNDTTTAFAFSSNLTSLVTSPFWSPVPRTVDENMFMTIGLGLTPCNSNQNCSGFFRQRLSSSMNNRSPSQVSLLEAVFRNISGIYTTDFPDTPPLIFDYTNANNSFDQSGLLFAPKLTSVKRVKYNATNGGTPESTLPPPPADFPKC
nr:laccase-7-like [Tanacetum cinerariifolium]